MNRLTRRGVINEDRVYFSGCLDRMCDKHTNYCSREKCDRRTDRSCPYLQCMDRLAAYEDTGMEPEVVKDMVENVETRLLAWFEARYDMPVGKLMDLIEAKQDGRLVVLPCKIGDTVWVTGTGGVMKCEIDEAHFDRDGLVFAVSFSCEKDWTNYYEACKGCPFNSWHQDYSGEWSCSGEWGRASINGSDFGKTAFLTREKAEKALAKEAEK